MHCKHTENEFDSNWNLLRKLTTVKRGIVETAIYPPPKVKPLNKLTQTKNPPGSSTRQT